MVSSSLRNTVQKNLTNWMLIPSIFLILSLGAYVAYEKSNDFAVNNIILTQSLGKHIASHLKDAEVALSSLSTSITRYDPFWFHWVLSNFLQAYPHFERLIYLDTNGKILVTSPQASELVSMELFIDKVSMKPKIISDPIASPATQNLVIYIGMRLQGGNILIGELSLSVLQKHFENLLPKTEGKLILCDFYGNLISHPDFQKVIRQENIGNLEIIRKFKEGMYQTKIYKDNDTYFLGTVSQIPHSNWMLLIAKPVRDVFFPIISPLIFLLTTIICLFFMCAHFLQYKLRESIILPLDSFTKSIELISKGNYKKPDFHCQTFSELMIIENEFEKMTQQINARENKIKENEERFRQLVENIHEAYWISSIENNKVIYVSPAYEVIWGRSQESLYENPESFFLAILAEDRIRVVESFDILRTEGEIVDQDFRIQLPDGKLRWIRAQAFPVYGDDGIRVRTVGVAEDITDRKDIETALIDAKKNAELASLAKTEFLTNMSHELRTPLNGVLGMLQLMTSTKLTNEQLEYVSTATTSSKVLLNVINDILNIAQIEAGKLTLRNELLSLPNVLETIYKFFKHSAESKGIVFSIEIEPGVSKYVIGDEVRIRQILFNLVGNSFKFTDEGRILVNVYQLPNQRKSNSVDILITVLDTGIGIPVDKITYVFESFTQVDGTYTRRHQGTGLGLGIVRSLVEYMNGSIVVDSDSGEGTIIYVTLQLELPTESAISPPVSIESPSPTKVSFNILVVEDDRVNQIAISRMLQKMGHKPTCVGDGQKAIDILMVKKFDCIFMDIQMPILDGIETTRIIRSTSQMSAISAIPIIALTAHAMPDDKKRFLETGMNDYISKPISFDQLERVLMGIDKT